MGKSMCSFGDRDREDEEDAGAGLLQSWALDLGIRFEDLEKSMER